MRGHLESEQTPMTVDRVPLRSLLAYSPPVVGLSGPLFLIQFYVLNFATDVLLLAPLAVGLLFAAGRVWDAVSDPIVGTLSDRTQTRIGRMELANNGTVFLDEIGDMPLTLQIKLLRVLAEGEIDRVGGSKPIKINIRVITATHSNLEEAIADGKFREDLFYRLNVIPIAIPPLRERQSDIPLLIHHYLKHFNQQKGKSITGISDAAVEILCNYQWPGNIRELANFMERMVVLSTDKALTPRDLPEKVLGDVPRETWEPLVQAESNETPAEFIRKSRNHAHYIGMPEEGVNLKKMVEEFEKELIIEALEKTNGVKNQAATLLAP